jgi:hypothetical protein
VVRINSCSAGKSFLYYEEIVAELTAQDTGIAGRIVKPLI